jgi:hypothetical protein
VVSSTVAAVDGSPGPGPSVADNVVPLEQGECAKKGGPTLAGPIQGMFCGSQSANPRPTAWWVNGYWRLRIGQTLLAPLRLWRFQQPYRLV